MATTPRVNTTSDAKLSASDKDAPDPGSGTSVSPVVQPEIAAGQSVEESKVPDGYAGRHGFDLIDEDGSPALKGRKLLAAAQLKAPSLTQEFVDAYGLNDDVLRQIADGTVSPPPAIGPAHTTDLYLTPGGWQQTKPGVEPGASDAIGR